MNGKKYAKFLKGKDTNHLLTRQNELQEKIKKAMSYEEKVLRDELYFIKDELKQRGVFA